MNIIRQDKKNTLNKKAFTMIEILVVVVIVSMLIAMGLYSFKFSVTEAKKNRSIIPQKAIDYNLLKSAINSMFYYVVEVEDKNEKKQKMIYFFEGSEREVTFITSSPAFAKELSIVNIFFKDENLIYKESPVYAYDQDFKNPKILNSAKEYILIRDVDSINFKYRKKEQEKQYFKDDIPDLISLVFTKDQTTNKYMFSIKSNFDEKNGYLHVYKYPM